MPNSMRPTSWWRVRKAILLAAVLLGSALVPRHDAEAQDAMRVYAAGSLRAAFTEISDRFSAAYPIRLWLEFGASGLLKERLERGEPGDVFASANMEHPLALAKQGKASPPVLFARNELCALVREGLPVTSATLLDTILDPTVRLGTSTPRADPSGDYAWELFRKAEEIRPGSRPRLEQKALQLTGGPNTPRPPPGTSPYVHAIRDRQADVFLTYCTNARMAVETLRGGSVVSVPPALRVGADYGLTVLNTAAPDKALKLVLFILSSDGQEILARHGFSAPTRPNP